MTSTPGRPTPAPFCASTENFAEGRDTPRAFLERCLERLDAWEPVIGAFVCTDPSAARAAADAATARWKAGRPLSRIDGMPVGVKDIIETFDLPTQMGSPVFDGWQAGRDAASTMGLRDAGAVIVGKTVTTEFAATEPRGTRNPWDPSHTPGGSSSGSAAAVAVGIVSAALGTQVIGSIVRPASYCGCVGFKPTVGAINRGGSHDYLSQSATGILAASLADAWQAMMEMAVRVGGDPGFEGLFGPATMPAPRRPTRIAVLETAGWAVATEAAKAVLHDAAERLAQQGVAVVTRRTDPRVEAVEQAVHDAWPLSNRINAFESIWPYKDYRSRDADKLSQACRDRLDEAATIGLDGYRKALAERARVRALYAALASDCDACIALPAPSAAPVGLRPTGNPICVVPGSMLGVPALSVPLFEEAGLPLGLQVLGFANGDADAFAVSAWLAEALGVPDA
ncbi:amidase [Rhodoplanes sp. TEM]|uniref:Amidase n=1 Tax=Rhodoplanes tepidamans TaxID=200616 RepID=A0ABT5J639_RHOTP|nr:MULTISPECIES: amidase [Rhodoplanes]MDC7785081.1 amidase [Rhodoplanes tepidamans]MDC7982555.1 amidase [Rhodoplanes sp. TEM]MDQ0356571.1 Asp-tRNA(Asn)/Glu-tRNA(Gln) amidotransferase A subunit family amidase [Rhodoplanes tepidamans]